MRVHLDADLDVGVTGAGLDVLPIGDRHLVPLVVADVEVRAVPGLHVPGGQLGARLGARGAGHGDHPLDPEHGRQLDRVEHVLGVLGTDRVGIEGVAVAVQRGQGHPGGVVAVQVLRAGDLAGPQLGDRQVRGTDEAPGVDLRTVQAEVGQGPQRVGKGKVMQAGGVRAKLHY